MKKNILERLPEPEMRSILESFKEAMKTTLENTPPNDLELILRFIQDTAKIPTISFFRYETASSIDFQLEQFVPVREFFYAVMYRFHALAGERDDYEVRMCTNLSQALNYAGPDAGLSRMHAKALLWTGTNTVHDAVTHEGMSGLFLSALDKTVAFFKPDIPYQQVMVKVLQNNRHLTFAALTILIFPELKIHSAPTKL